MKVFVTNKAGKKNGYEVPDDFRVDEFYCLLNNIDENTPDYEVHRQMAESKDSLVAKDGDYIPFSIHANATTTLAQLGFNSGSEYRIAQNYDEDRRNGGIA